MANKLSVYAPVDFVHQATVNFNGLEPSGALSTMQGRFIWAADTNQGLFDPWALGVSDALRVIKVHLIMAGQDSWELDFLDGKGTSTGYTSYQINSGTTESVISISNPATLAYGQALRIVTTGAGTTSVIANVTVVSANYPYYRE